MTEHLDLIFKRSAADYVTLFGVVPFILGLFFIAQDEPEFALIASAAAFFIDSVDGVIARKMKQESDFGRQLDSSLDLLIYIVFSALFVLKFLNPWFPLALLVVSIIIACGALRLLRFNKVGFVYKQGDRCYPGLGTAYILPAVAVLFIARYFWGAGVEWLTQLVLIGMSLAMISSVPIRKPKFTIWYPAAIAIVVLLILIRGRWL
ncbi:MAG: hypothetical protein A2677_00440 [Candidatus Komeilibacteria bacterium RIFCSPHIGHO2_01_FULL_52_14]|uniref:CDP-diacylglycerol--serine O-phosphatidyltransferase n=1 Tax=Candidatus Komeilibacteria bacterium RIFCSPHIGHO2_01_FULL_52_14 TaxID=1798549 RepID=A0A1G2BLU8_9BACT|nr:MAG: hypothetical protein A2677_00440 [Candidatus Komeilibacteria bacterium RIFCSPHIGHO2_01_FULL_52_14]